MTKPERLRSTNHSSPATGNKNDYDDSNFSNQSKYKKFTNFLEKSNLINQQQQQQNKKSETLECNCWVCKILDSSSESVVTNNKTTIAAVVTKCYEPYNIISDTGDSIFYDPLLSNIFNNNEEVVDKPIREGQIYHSRR